MTTTIDDPKPSNLEKDPDEWVSGDDPMTGAQASYLKTLCEEAKEDFDESLNKAEASKRIDELRERTASQRATQTSDAAVSGVASPLQPPTEICFIAVM